MAIKNIIAQGIGFDNAGDSTTKFVPTLGFTPGVASGTTLLQRVIRGTDPSGLDDWTISYQA